MANPLAEAFVRLRPDLSSFQTEAQAGIQRAVGRVSVPTQAQRGLGAAVFGPAFRSELEGAVVRAPTTVTVPDAAQRTFAQKMFGPGFRNEAGRAIQGALSGLGGGQLAAQFAFFGPGGAAAAVLGGALLTAAVSAARFERELDVLQETSQATDDELARLEQRAIELGASIDLPAVTAADAAAAMTELAKAGLSVQDTFDGVEGVLQLATAAETDAATAARIAAAALNAFGLAGTEAVNVADLLAGASIAASGDIGDMALALQQAAAVANQAGLGLDQTVGAITALAKAGLLGSDAGTSLRTMLLRLIPTTKEAASFQRALGIEIDKTRTLGQQLPELIDQYRSSLDALPPVQRQATLQQIFGTDAIRAASIIFGQSAAALERQTREADRAGAAADLAAARTEGLAGAYEAVISASQTLATSTGQILIPALTEAAEMLVIVINAAGLAAEALGELQSIADQGFQLPFTDVDINPLKDFAFFSLKGGLAGVALQKTLQELRGESEETTQTLENLSNAVANTISELAGAFRQAGEPFRLARTLGIDAEELERLQQVVREEGTEAGLEMGRRFARGLGDGIDQEEQRAIDAARRTLEGIRREGDRQIQEAIRSARANLETLGETLTDQIAEVIDIGPIGRALDELEQRLDELQERVSRRQLRFDLTQAEQDLRDARESIQRLGEATPAQQRAINEFLAPFRENVLDAKSALEEFTVEESIERLEQLKQKQIETAEQGIQRLIDGFQDGKISVGEFNALLTRQLQPSLDILRRQAGTNLGLSISRDFLQQVETLRQQAQALAGFLGRPGTAPGGQVVRPAEVAADVAQRIRDQTLELQLLRQDASKLSKDEQEKLDIQIALLRELIRLLGGSSTGKVRGNAPSDAGDRGRPGSSRGGGR